MKEELKAYNAYVAYWRQYLAEIPRKTIYISHGKGNGKTFIFSQTPHHVTDNLNQNGK